MNGTVKRIVGDRGFGFIKPASGKDVFFHISGLTKGLSLEDLQEGDRVDFDTEDGEKGPRAINVRRSG